MFETYVYQPFFNVLVGIYYVLGQISPELEDMGVAVIIFAILVRIVTFPLTIAGERSEEEKRKIVERVQEVKREHAHDPVRQKAEVKLVMRGNIRTVLATTANLLIQLGIILMLYRIFNTGLTGRDFHLLYSFMPDVTHVNLLFLGKYDLSHTNATLNLLQSVMIFIVEFLVALRSPLAVSRRDVALLQFVLPIASYFVFIFLPAGKKVFIITSLAFSALYQSFRLMQSWSQKLIERFTPKPPLELTRPVPPLSDQADKTDNPPQLTN